MPDQLCILNETNSENVQLEHTHESLRPAIRTNLRQNPATLLQRMNDDIILAALGWTIVSHAPHFYTARDGLEWWPVVVNGMEHYNERYTRWMRRDLPYLPNPHNYNNVMGVSMCMTGLMYAP